MAKGKLMKQISHTELDVDTGEFRRVIEDVELGYIDQEPEYIKIYVGTQLSLNNLDPSLAPYVIAFSEFLTYANNPKYEHMVQTNDFVRESVAKKLGVSDIRVKQMIRKMVDAGIFIPVYKKVRKKSEDEGIAVEKRVQKRGLYFVNPWVIAKGKWQDIKKLQQKIDFIKGVSSYTFDDGTGEKSISVDMKEYRQLTMRDYLGIKQEGAQQDG